MIPLVGAVAGCVKISPTDATVDDVYIADRSAVHWYASGVTSGFLDPLALAIQFTSAWTSPNGAFAMAYFCDQAKEDRRFGGLFVMKETNNRKKLLNTYVVLLNLKSPFWIQKSTTPYDLQKNSSDICLYTIESGSYTPIFSNTMRVTATTIRTALTNRIRVISPDALK